MDKSVDMPKMGEVLDTVNPLVKQQEGLNANNFFVNHTDERGPNGNVTWSVDPSGRWTRTTSLPKNQQKALNLANRQYREALQNPELNLSSAPTSTFSQDQLKNLATAGPNSTIENAMYDRFKGRADQQYDQSESAMNSRLANSGATVGSKAWQAQQRQFAQNKNDAYAGAAVNAYQQGAAESQRQYGNATNQRQAWLQDVLARRNGLAGARSGVQVATPSISAPSSPYVDALGAGMGIYGQKMNANIVGAQNEAAFWSSVIQSVASAAGGAAASDIRVKENIHEMDNATADNIFAMLAPYSFNYKGQDKPTAGLMAQHLENTPLAGAVYEDSYGSKYVDYGQLFGALSALLVNAHRRIKELEGKVNE